MEKFEELAQKLKEGIGNAITTEMSEEQITQFGELQKQVDGLIESHKNLEKEAISTKEKYIDLVKGFGTSKLPVDETAKEQPRSLEEIANAMANAK